MESLDYILKHFYYNCCDSREYTWFYSIDFKDLHDF